MDIMQLFYVVKMDTNVNIMNIILIDWCLMSTLAVIQQCIYILSINFLIYKILWN